MFTSKTARSGFAVFAYALALAAQYQTAQYPVAAALILIASVLWNAWLFRAQLKALRITYPKGTIVESPIWLYLFAVSAIGMTVAAGCNLYYSNRNCPGPLGSAGFAESYLHGKHIRIAELINPSNQIIGRTIEDSWIYGPAVLYLTDLSSIANCTFGSSKNLLFMQVPLNTAAGAGTGVIGVRDTKFRRCHFVNITLVGTAEQIDAWVKRNDESLRK
ncbi:hypothetical protein [uncultured Paludibaculum sp.]|uniref:hypothetical protein n=1 Tax=uncultured Paludibaculum sp. TaxID=1765020 RepID=UPI002AABD1A6|nr:hypothetical protein [uncultured Paludibaculum sp.]